MHAVSVKQTLTELYLQSLNELKEKSNYCNSENFNCLKQTADDKTLTMLPSAQVHSQKFDFEHFINHVFTKLIDALIKEMIDAFSQLKFWSVFDIIYPRKLPQSVTEISSYGNQEMTVLIDHYSIEKASKYKSVTVNWVGDIDGVAAVEECFISMFEKYKAEKEKFQIKLMNCKNKKERDTFHASETSFDAHKLYSTCLNDKACATIFLKLLHLMLIFQLSTAFVKRFFSKMKLVKTRL